jgi:predicted ATPase
VATATRGLGRTSVVGRETEVAALEAFLRRDDSPRALVFAGGAGIGKTTLWETGVALAKAQGFRVLSTRPTDAEAQFSFGALVDLLDGVDTKELKNLPAPQQRALDVALLRAESAGEPPEPQTIAVALLNTLRALAARGPILVAVDDVQWLDPSSAAALTFAARRLGDEPVVFLLAMRSGHPSGLVRALEPRLHELEVGPLSLGAMRRLLSERHGLSLSRHRLAGSSRPRSATRCSRSRSGAPWPSREPPRPARSCRCRTRSRTCSACACPGSRPRSAGCCLRSP